MNVIKTQANKAYLHIEELEHKLKLVELDPNYTLVTIYRDNANKEIGWDLWLDIDILSKFRATLNEEEETKIIVPKIKRQTKTKNKSVTKK